MSSDITDDEAQRLVREHLMRLADQIHGLVWRQPNDRTANVIKIVQPSTRRASLVPGSELELLDAALELASRGFRIFPVAGATHRIDDGRDGKVPLITGWPERASTDPKTIRAWWGDEFVGANIGVATGAGSDLTVVDLDHRPDEGKDGPAVLAALEREHGQLPPLPRVQRGTSRHDYFRHVPELRSINGVMRGVDIKGDGGYVVAPPSFHRGGDRYRFVGDTGVLAPPVMPRWLVEALMASSSAEPPARRSRAGMTLAIGIEDEDVGRYARSANVETIRQTVTIDEVLEAHGRDATPCVCPLHEDADCPTAFTSNKYGGASLWTCWTGCKREAEAGGDPNHGDVIDLIQRLHQCTFVEALAIGELIFRGEFDVDDE